MGIKIREGTTGNKIKDFWPDDTDTEIYIEASICPNFVELILKANEKWPGIDPHELEVEAKYIQTQCLDYDRYDPMDYTNFIILRRRKGNMGNR